MLQRRPAVDALRRLPAGLGVTSRASTAATQLRDRGIFATRQLAKRQLTWLRAWAGLQAFDCLDAQLAPKVLAALQWAVES